jgi:hypothetical protein
MKAKGSLSLARPSDGCSDSAGPRLPAGLPRVNCHSFMTSLQSGSGFHAHYFITLDRNILLAITVYSLVNFFPFDSFLLGTLFLFCFVFLVV